MSETTIHQLGLGGGCHWCTEAIFLSLKGVKEVQQGWIASEAPHARFSEAVIVHFDPTVIPVGILVAIHLFTHSATSDHTMRQKYRSALYYFSPAEKPLLEQAMEAFTDLPLVTSILPFKAFKSSLPAHQNYYFNGPDKPFCQRYIHPKLELLIQNFTDHVDLQKLKTSGLS